MITDDAVSQPESEVIHRAGRWHADIPVAEAARIVLNRTEGTGLQHFHHGGGRHHAVKVTRPDVAAAKRVAGGNLAQIVEVGGDAVQLSGIQRMAKFFQSSIAGVGMHDQFGDHRIVEAGDLAAGFDAAVDPHAVRESYAG